ncbi:MAG: glycosyltransferase family 2 protein [Pseudomonadota bacterium]
MQVSVIVTTYNREDALLNVLNSLINQNHSEFEVIVADDGSTRNTQDTICEFHANSQLNLKHIWQEDKGFRAAKSRNKAVAESEGDYLIFMDGDCIAFPNFISKHIQLAEQGYFVRGSRVMLSESYTQEFIHSQIQPPKISVLDLLCLWKARKIKRIAPLVTLPLGMLRKLKEKNWYGVKTCNLGMWREDFLAVNGFDEQYIGWGHEDADLAIRLINNGVYRKEGVNAVTVLHLWHALNDRTHLEDNENRLEKRLRSNTTRINLGVSQYL